MRFSSYPFPHPSSMLYVPCECLGSKYAPWWQMLRADLLAEEETVVRKFNKRYWKGMYCSDPFVPTCCRYLEATRLTSSGSMLSILVSHGTWLEPSSWLWAYSEVLLDPRYLNEPFHLAYISEEAIKAVKNQEMVGPRSKEEWYQDWPRHQTVGQHNREYCFLFWRIAKLSSSQVNSDITYKQSKMMD